MVRPGIMLYGSNPCRHETIELRPAMSLQTRVVNILNVQKGETVGYGRVWTADRDSVIAVLGIGYADGLMRCLQKPNHRGHGIIDYHATGIEHT